ncbi:MAG: IclR family transcriptional regulator [Eubacteriales bacterium]|nr:IclR family transcriptional regulator [Eubacteriales bacterium]
MTKTNGPTVNAVDRALSIIETIYESGGEMGIADIARKTGEYQSTIFRTLITFEARGFVYQNAENSKYGLGMKLFSIGMGVRDKLVIVRVVEPFAKRLCDETGETINVSVRDNLKTEEYYSLLVHQEVKKGQALGVSQNLGSSTPCYYSAVGKALLAYADDLSKERVKRGEFCRFTEHSITDPETMWKELENIRQQGYSLDNEEQEKGLFCVACPVFDRQNRIKAAISVSGYVARIKEIGIDNILQKLRPVCSEIGALL